MKTANEILLEKRASLVDGVPRGMVDGDLSGASKPLEEAKLSPEKAEVLGKIKEILVAAEKKKIITRNERALAYVASKKGLQGKHHPG